MFVHDPRTRHGLGYVPGPRDSDTCSVSQENFLLMGFEADVFGSYFGDDRVVFSLKTKTSGDLGPVHGSELERDLPRNV